MLDDRCIASIVRLTKTVQLKPMTTYKLRGKLNKIQVFLMKELIKFQVWKIVTLKRNHI